MFNLHRLIKSFVYAFKGLLKVFYEEQNLRIQIFVALLVIIIGWYYQLKLLEWCLIILAIAIVMLMEIVNSVAERVSDVLRPRINSYVKEIKDIAAASVIVASIFAVIIGLIIFLPYIFGKN